MKFIINVDGGSRGNPGPSAGGVVIRDGEGEILLERGLYYGHATNNIAEYRACIDGLRLLKELLAKGRPGEAEVLVRSDSELLVKQLSGEYRIKNAGLKPLAVQAQAAMKGFKSVKLEAVRREMNEDADRMVNRALDEGRDVHE